MGLIFSDDDWGRFDKVSKKWDKPKPKGGFIVRLTFSGLRKVGVPLARLAGKIKRTPK